MSKRRDLADLPADIVVSRPQVLAKAYRDYHRYSVTLKGEDHPVVQERDVLIGGKVVVVSSRRRRLRSRRSLRCSSAEAASKARAVSGSTGMVMALMM